MTSRFPVTCPRTDYCITYQLRTRLFVVLFIHLPNYQLLHSQISIHSATTIVGMEEIPRKADLESTTEWLQTVADETDTDFKVLKSITTQLRPELISLPDSEKRYQLQQLLKEHTEFMTEVEGDADAWIDFYFERDGEIDSYYQYSMMSHNLARVTERELESMKEVAEEEDMDVENQIEHNFVIAEQFDWNGVEEELRLVRKVLSEVYDVDIDELERVEEEREGETISWTDV